MTRAEARARAEEKKDAYLAKRAGLNLLREAVADGEAAADHALREWQEAEAACR